MPRSCSVHRRGVKRLRPPSRASVAAAAVAAATITSEPASKSRPGGIIRRDGWRGGGRPFAGKTAAAAAAAAEVLRRSCGTRDRRYSTAGTNQETTGTKAAAGRLPAVETGRTKCSRDVCRLPLVHAHPCGQVSCRCCKKRFRCASCLPPAVGRTGIVSRSTTSSSLSNYLPSSLPPSF